MHSTKTAGINKNIIIIKDNRSKIPEIIDTTKYHYESSFVYVCQILEGERKYSF